MCGYHCCRQLLPKEGAPVAGESILLFPGEYERACEAGTDRARHIRLIGSDDNGGDYGFCDPTIIDQGSCHPARNFKPLDCRSYPLFPVVRDGRIMLYIDTRCPISRDNRERLQDHARMVLRAWEREIERDPRVQEWLENLHLPTYEPFDLDNK